MIMVWKWDSRLKSLAWRTGGMLFVVVVSQMLQNAEMLMLPAWSQVFLGLVLGEVTKALNSKK